MVVAWCPILADSKAPWFCDSKRLEDTSNCERSSGLKDAHAIERRYKQRTNYYCEGLDPRNISLGGSRNFDLVSFSYGKLQFTDKDRSLRVNSIGPSDKEIQLRITSTIRSDYYRLDGMIPANGSLEWDLVTLVHSVGIKDGMLGLVGYFLRSNAAQTPIYVPISVTDHSPDNQFDPESMALIVSVKPRYPVSDVKWRLMKQESGICTVQVTGFKYADGSGGLSNSVRYFQLDASSRENITGTVICLEVEGKEGDGESIPLTDRFFIMVPSAVR